MGLSMSPASRAPMLLPRRCPLPLTPCRSAPPAARCWLRSDSDPYWHRWPRTRAGRAPVRGCRALEGARFLRACTAGLASGGLDCWRKVRNP